MYDWLIRNVRIIDGSGAAAFRGDVALRGEKIAAVGQLDDVKAARVLEREGRFLTPGLIDIHRHAGGALFRPGFGAAELAQGLTTVVNGNCGLSPAPVYGPHSRAVQDYLTPIVGQVEAFCTLADYRSAANRQPLPLNAGVLVGMGTLRACVAGFRAGELTGEEYRQIHAGLERALADGALGVSLGLGYAPECFYTTEGLLRALAPLRRSGRVISVHMRQEGDGAVEALEEMLSVARALETPVEISHLKAIGRRNWRRAVPQMLRMLAEARAEGVDVGCDVYPYPAGSTQLIHILPPEFQAGGPEALLASLCDPDSRSQMRRRMERDTDFENIVALVGFENIRAVSLCLTEHREFEGRSLAEIAAAQGKDPYDALFDLLAAERCTPGMIDFIADEADIEAILCAPFSGVVSDATYPAGLPHPRVWGTFPRLLETYVAKREVLALPAAIHKVTGQAAERLGLRQKGRIQPGADADLCLFHLGNIRETAAWQAPARMAEGMDYVFVGGVPAVSAGRLTGQNSGRHL